MLPETKTLTLTTQTSANAVVTDVDFAPMLERHGLKYMQAGHYLVVGPVEQVQGWLLHISVILPKVSTLMEKLIPILINEAVPFKIARSYETAKALLFGYLGYPLMGKVITIYPNTADKAVQLAKILIRNTQELPGPTIPTDYHLGGAVYTRYGGFNPVTLIEANGSLGRYIYDNKGRLVKDDYQIPFRPVAGVKWPFKAIRPFKPQKDRWLLKGRYKSAGILKRDVKGRVIRAFDFKNWFNIQLRIIKEGVRYMNSDEAGRHMFDRIRWQYQLHKALEGIIEIPKAVDCFEERGNIYFVMEFVEGLPLSEVVNTMFAGKHWVEMEPAKQYALAASLQMILEGLEKLQAAGYYHRDLSPRNFLIKPDGRPIFIDLELASNRATGYPTPPFVLGTYGYMSPEQIRVEQPTEAQDVYGVGGLIVRVFTGISPKLLDVENPEKLYDSLQFLMGNSHLASFACACLSFAPAERPSLSRTTEFIREWTAGMDKQTVHSKLPAGETSRDAIRATIEQAIAALGTTRMATEDGIWFSKTIKDEKFISNEALEINYYPGLHTGIGGVLYTIATAHAAGYRISEACQQLFNRNYQFFDGTQQQLQQNPIPGLFNGSPGISLVIMQLLGAGIIQGEQPLLERVKQGLLAETQDFGISTGIAGHGLAVIHCRNLVGYDPAKDIILRFANHLADRQESDGSWIIRGGGFPAKGAKSTGFYHGIAGIVYFLLAAHEFTGDVLALQTATNGLDFLEKAAIVTEGKLTWLLYPNGPAAGGWLDYGATGIVLPFIRAFAVTGTERYKTIASAALRMHPEHIITPFLGISAGVAGIGEAYLEASRVFREREWYTRAGWIVEYLLHLNRSHADGTSSWITDNSTLPTGDLMTGNCGVLHFLMRYLDPEKISLPVFN